MKRVDKNTNSIILKENLVYVINGKNNRLSFLLKAEQRGFCAYTEKLIMAVDLVEIDHFNPQLKGTRADSYQNWFLIMAKWNRKKSSKWLKYQPIMSPSDQDFAERIWFEDFVFNYKKDDVEAKNLVELLELNNYELTQDREKYIKRMLDLRTVLGTDKFIDHLYNHKDQIYFLTAFESTFDFAVII